MTLIQTDKADKVLADALNRVQRAQADLADMATDGVRSEQLASVLVRLAEAEGRLTVARQINALKDNPDALDEAFTRLLLRGADDGWSGRTNDVRRAYFDGVRSEVEDFKNGWLLR